MQKSRLDSPIFFIGMPRSGTTIIFERFSMHPALGWISNYSSRFPNKPAWNMLVRLSETSLWQLRGEKKQHKAVHFLNRYLPKPHEGNLFWKAYCGSKFLWDFHQVASDSSKERARLRRVVDNTLKYQGKSRFTAKFTGPPRIHILKSIFPDAKFVHIIRDGRAVVDSLMKVDFWRSKGGLVRPFWEGALTDKDVVIWENAGRASVVLAALQWRRVIEVTRDEKRVLPDDRYLEIRYEDFVDEPEVIIQGIDQFAGLPDYSRERYSSKKDGTFINMNRSNSEFSAMERELVTNIMGDLLRELRYTLE